MDYREWYELMLGAGLTVAGKDPLAVFLTQLSRSPVLRKGTQPGVYELDRRAPATLRRRLEQLHIEMRDLTRAPAATTGLASVRARRAELTSEVGRLEKALEEAERLLGGPPDASLAAVG